MSNTEQTQPTEATLGLADLALMANIIQVTTERGAIKAAEMETVGALYKKLAAFVNANVPSDEQDENSQDIQDPADDQEEGNTEDQ